MFGLENLDGWKLLVLALVGIFIFGPDKLPKAIADGVKFLRTLREMARNATGDLNRELGTDLQLEDLHPKTLIRKHLLSEEDEKALRKPIEDLYRDVRSDLKGLGSEVKSVTDAVNGATRPGLSAAATATAASAVAAVSTSSATTEAPAAAAAEASVPGPRRRIFDADAT